MGENMELLSDPVKCVICQELINEEDTIRYLDDFKAHEECTDELINQILDDFFAHEV